MKKKVEKTIKIDDGKHTGVITDIEYRTEPYEYVDVKIKLDDLDIEMKCGFPFNISENSALGNALISFGATLTADEEIEIEDYLKKDMKVEFLTMNEKGKKGTFARIQPMSLKPSK